MAPDTMDKIPTWSWAAPLAACALLAGKFSGLLSGDSLPVLIAAAALLAASVFASVHHAEVIALRVGEPFGSIVLAIAVTVIEASLIVSIMLSASGASEALARDTVYATVMIVLNGVVGLCLVIGGARHHEQNFRTDAAAAALSVLGTLSILALVLPNYTLTSIGPVYAPSQLVFVSAVSIVLYCVFLFVQTIRHRAYFLNVTESDADEGSVGGHPSPPSTRTALASLLLLALSLVAVVLLAKALSPALESAVETAGLPTSFVGVVIAAVVLLPETMAALNAANKNHLQTSLNLALGSAMATIGLTIPVVGLVALTQGQTLVLGLGPEEMVLLLLTLIISMVTLATGRTTILQGAVHLVIFTVFLLLSVVP